MICSWRGVEFVAAFLLYNSLPAKSGMSVLGALFLAHRRLFFQNNFRREDHPLNTLLFVKRCKFAVCLALKLECAC